MAERRGHRGRACEFRSTVSRRAQRLLVARGVLRHYRTAVAPPCRRLMDIALSTWALVVGIDEYQGEYIPPLKGPARDAVAAVSWLRKLGVRDESILLHAHPSADAESAVEALDLTRRGCTNDEILDSLLVLERTKGQRLFVFLTGHGLYEPATGPLFLTQDAREGCMRNL